MTRADSKPLREAVLRLERELEAQLPRALSFAGDLVANRARLTTLFKDRTGALRRSILRGPVVGSVRGGDLRVDVRAGGGRLRYASAVHDGSQAHLIRASRRRALRFVGRGGDFRFARVVHHPGTRPRPFITEAAEAVQPEAVAALESATQLAFVRAGFA